MNSDVCPRCNGRGDFEGGGNLWNYCYDCHGTGRLTNRVNGIDVEKLYKDVEKMNEEQLQSLWRWITAKYMSVASRRDTK